MSHDRSKNCTSRSENLRGKHWERPDKRLSTRRSPTDSQRTISYHFPNKWPRSYPGGRRSRSPPSQGKMEWRPVTRPRETEENSGTQRPRKETGNNGSPMEQSKTESSTVLRAQREANVTTKNHEPRGEPEVEKEKEQNRSQSEVPEIASHGLTPDSEKETTEGREEEEQIEAVAQLSQNRSTRPPLGERMKEKSAPQVKETSKEAALDEQNDKNGKTSLTPLGKKRGAKSPDLKGDSASRKLANRGRLSPKKKQFKPSRDPIIPARSNEADSTSLQLQKKESGDLLLLGWPQKGGWRYRTWPVGWTADTADGKRSALGKTLKCH
ncbi:hypothetical protein YC2023_048886 [Brassica napus]